MSIFACTFQNLCQYEQLTSYYITHAAVIHAITQAISAKGTHEPCRIIKLNVQAAQLAMSVGRRKPLGMMSRYYARQAEVIPFLQTLMALYIREHKPSLDTRDEYIAGSS